jgi:hypothetical protein
MNKRPDAAMAGSKHSLVVVDFVEDDGGTLVKLTLPASPTTRSEPCTSTAGRQSSRTSSARCSPRTA